MGEGRREREGEREGKREREREREQSKDRSKESELRETIVIVAYYILYAVSTYVIQFGIDCVCV